MVYIIVFEISCVCHLWHIIEEPLTNTLIWTMAIPSTFCSSKLPNTRARAENRVSIAEASFSYQKSLKSLISKVCSLAHKNAVIAVIPVFVLESCHLRLHSTHTHWCKISIFFKKFNSNEKMNLNFPAKNVIIENLIIWTKIGILPQCATVARRKYKTFWTSQ